MSYLHCHSCDWGQDDFWDAEGYNPFDKGRIKWWREILIDGITGKEIQLSFGSEFLLDHPDVPHTKGDHGDVLVDFRDFLALELEKAARSIKKMKWPTFEDYKNDPNKVCPKCGSSNLDID